MNTQRKPITFIDGTHDAVVNGKLEYCIPTRTIFVNSQEERDALPDILPGTVVATYGMSFVWQKDGNGGWETIRQGGG